MPYLYPPLTAMAFFVPLSYLPAGAAALVWNTVSLVALGAVVWLTLGIAGIRDGKAKVALTLAGLILATCLLPVRVQLIAGQINMFLLLLVLMDFRRSAGKWRGIGIGIAAGLKITPLIFIAYLVITRRWGAARNAVAAFMATVAVGFLLAPADSATYWGGLVFHSSRAGGVFDTPNQSLSGALARVLSGEQFANWWLVVLGVVAVYGLAVAAWAFRRGADFLGFSATAVTGLLVSPISWEHHWVYVIPLLIWLTVWAHRRRARAVAAVTAVLVAVFTVRVFMLLGIEESPPAPMALAAWEQVIAAMFPLTGLLLLLLGPLWVRRHFEPASAPRDFIAGDPPQHGPTPPREDAADPVPDRVPAGAAPPSRPA
ncbi:hypothetical protein GCM10009716_27780 [Streptomyces sodiiphilus]|uniref:DUF2029 domain-containing protein n=2 Tax=Streptomyces sodiiphilus TaxID=226217 RepID=A0ABN2PBW2_9ACTN